LFRTYILKYAANKGSEVLFPNELTLVDLQFLYSWPLVTSYMDINHFDYLKFEQFAQRIYPNIRQNLTNNLYSYLKQLKQNDLLQATNQF
jgi:hypothetical protein